MCQDILMLFYLLQFQLSEDINSLVVHSKMVIYRDLCCHGHISVRTTYYGLGPQFAKTLDLICHGHISVRTWVLSLQKIGDLSCHGHIGTKTTDHELGSPVCKNLQLLTSQTSASPTKPQLQYSQTYWIEEEEARLNRQVLITFDNWRAKTKGTTGC